jgi:hypothetical protein
MSSHRLQSRLGEKRDAAARFVVYRKKLAWLLSMNNKRAGSRQSSAAHVLPDYDRLSSETQTRERGHARGGSGKFLARSLARLINES